jgi:hypothetical protein
MKKKVKRYQEGGEAELKARGLESSKGDKVGFFERLKMGNIDDPRSEAYRRFGAGRAKMDIEAITPVPESAKESSDYSGRRATTPESPKSEETTMSITERLRAASPGSNIPRMDGEGGGYTSPVKKEVKAKPKKSKLQRQNELAKRMARGYAKAADSGAVRATGSGASIFPVKEDLEYTTKTGTGASGFKKGGKVSASSRADGIAQRGKTRGRIC